LTDNTSGPAVGVVEGVSDGVRVSSLVCAGVAVVVGDKVAAALVTEPVVTVSAAVTARVAAGKAVAGLP
jgi:hypothetical protein